MGVALGMPGVRAIRSTTETNLIWGGDDNKAAVLMVQAQMESALVDAGVSPTSDIGAGLLLGSQTTGGQHIQWIPTATDGSELLRGVLAFDFSTLDEDAVTEDHFMPMIVRAPLMAVNLTIEGAAFVGHTNEFLARRTLQSMGCVLDDDIGGYLAGAATRYQNKTADYTVVAADNGTIFTSSTNDTDYTLPTLVPGLTFDFVQTANQELTVLSAGSLDDIIGANDAALDQVQFTTTGEQIGARMCFESVYVGSTLKWLYYIKKVAFSTDDYLVSAAT